METLKIIGFATFAAILYGVLHDQVTAHLCVEYFTIGHPPIFPTDSPLLLALGWGIIATWWVGLPLGIGLALAARAGPAPRLALAQLRRPILLLMLGCGVLALLAGIAGAIGASLGWVWLVGWLAEAVPRERHVAFLADLWAHSASYAGGLIGGLTLMALTWWRRSRLR
ncbi:hypothetical protein ACCC88_05325 [Sphingomonas sp. Sphisp140]|uniref:hypothetical protein n=1 Tax=unclassified Sphingomonas TaxID=196159 RepID=UPI0039AEE743